MKVGDLAMWRGQVFLVLKVNPSMVEAVKVTSKKIANEHPLMSEGVSSFPTHWLVVISQNKNE